MRVLVVGSTGGSGRAAVSHLLARGHEVTALARGAAAGFAEHPRLRVVRGDATSAADVERAVDGHDAVVVTLGIRENPIGVRLFGAKGTRGDVRSTGTRHVIAAMRKRGIRRLVVQSSYGVGATRERLGFVDGLIFALLLRPQIADTEVQEAAVRESGLDWVLVQPVHLHDGPDDPEPFTSTEGATGAMKVSRGSVGRFLAVAVEGAEYVGRSVALSAPA